jgi:glycosyltransferase involved in cell wall biosynthesis
MPTIGRNGQRASRGERITIVTISFNQVRFLEAALKSVLDQNDSNLDYIVVDPGSTDGSRELLRGYEAQLASLILEPDGGPSEGLRRGFRDVRGGICGFLNADDLLMPGSLASIRAFFEKQPATDLLIGDGLIVDAAGRCLQRITARYFAIGSYLHGGASWLQQSTFFKKSIYDQTEGFNKENRTCWDGELFLRMLQNDAKVGYLHQELGCFRLHDASITGGGAASQNRYLVDRDRLYEGLYHRKWGLQSEVLSLLYRIRLSLRDPGRIYAALSKRIGRRR